MNNTKNIEKSKDTIFSNTIEKQIKKLRNVNTGKDLLKYKDLYQYLCNRFEGIKPTEAYYMIIHNMIHRPICPVCNKNEVKFITLSCGYNKFCSSYCSHYSDDTKKKFKETCLNRYGSTSPLNSKKIQEKIKETCIKKYGVDNYSKSDIYKENYKKTCLERYGVDNAAKSTIVKEKQKQTCLKKYGKISPLLNEQIKLKTKETINNLYGVDFYFQSNDFKEKSALTKFLLYQNPNYNNRYKYEQTNIKKYGCPIPIQNPKIKEKIEKTNLRNLGVKMPLISNKIQRKIKQTNFEKYGQLYQSTLEYKEYLSYKISTEEVQDKINNTKRKNNTFNTSKPEEELYLYIKSKFPNVKRQYKDNIRYPYNCDFYIPELDMFIELQGTWTHGKHPFNINSKEDMYILNKWKEKSKNHLWYLNAIETWTNKDIKKRETAKENNLNFKEIWTLQEGKKFIDSLK